MNLIETPEGHLVVNPVSKLYKYLGDHKEDDRDYKTLEESQFYAAPYHALNDEWDDPRKFFADDLSGTLPKGAADFLTVLIDNVSGFGVYCLSATNHSGPMWAHYANVWSGLCIEYAYGGKELFEHLRLFHAEELQGGLPMRYVKSPLKIDRERLSLPQDSRKVARDIFSQKFRPWSYEEEFRLVFSKPRLYHMPPSLISGVYLGFKMEDRRKQMYVSMLRNKSIPVWEARPSYDRYALDAKRLG